MSVKPEKIQERLRVLFPSVNLSKKRIDELSARLATKPADEADDTAIDAVINTANDFIPFSDIAREDDKIRGLEAKVKKSTEEKTPQELADEAAAKKLADDKKAKDDKELDEAPAWAKAFMKGVNDNVDSINEKVSDIQSGKVTETKIQEATSLFEASDVLKTMKPEHKQSWLKRVNVDSETPLEDQIKTLATEYSDLVQFKADEQEFPGAPPTSFANNKPTDKEIDDLVDDL